MLSRSEREGRAGGEGDGGDGDGSSGVLVDLGRAVRSSEAGGAVA